MPTPHKTCTKCGDTKPLDEYYKNKSTKDGRRGQCKECAREYSRAYHEENREKISERSRAYHEANREKARERRSAYYEANREKINGRKRAYREANQEELKEKQRAYRHENRDFIRRDNSRRKGEMNALTRLTATRNGKPWEQWEDDFIAAHPEMATYQIANHIGRTDLSTQTRKADLRRKGVLAQ